MQGDPEALEPNWRDTGGGRPPGSDRGPTTPEHGRGGDPEEPDRSAAVRADAEWAEVDRAWAQRVAAQKAEAERRARAERARAERAEAERAATQKAAAERAEAERVEAERAEAERVEAERAAAQKAAAERAEAERVEAERSEAERSAAEKADAERSAAEKADAERAEAERVEAERVEAERAAAQEAEAERIAAEPSEPGEPAQAAAEERTVEGREGSRAKWPLAAAAGAVAVTSLVVWLTIRGDEPRVRLVGVGGSGAPQSDTLVIDRGTVSVPQLGGLAARAGRRDAVVLDDEAFRLTVPVVVAPGGTLVIEDVTLHLSSDARSFVTIEARGGTVHIDRASVLSWDAEAATPDTRVDDGRAALLATKQGNLEVESSTIGAMGYDKPDWTGVTWSGKGTGGYVRDSRFQDNMVGADFRSTASAIEIADAVFERAFGPGLRLAGTRGVKVADTTFGENRGDGLYVTDGSSHITVAGGQSDGNGRSGVALDGGSTDIDIRDLSAHANVERGISASGAQKLVVDGTVLTANHVGVLIDGDSAAQLEHNRVSGNRAAGVWVQGDRSTATLVSNRLDHNGGAGLLVMGGKATVGPDDTIVENAIGIRIEDPSPDVTVTDSVVQGNGDVGVSIVATDGVQLTKNQITENVSAPFAVRTRHSSARFASVNTLLPGKLGWEVVRAARDSPTPGLGAPPPLEAPPPPEAAPPA